MISEAVVYVSGYLFVLFAAVSFAAGIYYLCELAEEWPTFTKRIIKATIYVNFFSVHKK